MKIDNPTTTECSEESKQIDAPLNPFQSEIFDSPQNAEKPAQSDGVKNEASNSGTQEPDAFEKLWSLPGLILGGLDKNQFGNGTHEIFRDSYRGSNDEIDKAAMERVMGSMSDFERANFDRDRIEWHKAQEDYDKKFLRASTGTGMLGFPAEPQKPENISKFEEAVERMRAKILEEMRQRK